MPILEVRDVSKSFGSLRVLESVSMTLNEGEILGVIGPNGAGKSVSFGLITGDLQPNSGSVFFEGRNVTAQSSTARCRMGIGRTYQIPQPFSGLTVYENVLVGGCFGTGRKEKDARVPARQVLEQTGLLDKANKISGKLPLLDRKRLELARALATEPKVLLLDEIAGGLSDAEVTELVQTICDIRDSGVSIIWVEHIVHALVSAIDRLVVIDSGSVLTEGDPEAVFADDRVREVYMGIAVE